MNYLFKTAAGVMSAIVLAAGTGITANLNRNCSQDSPNSCTIQTNCVSGADCNSINNADLQKLIGECENTSELLKVLLENNICSKEDLNCITDSENCTVEDVCKALANCDTDRCDIVSVIENACAEHNESCSDHTAEDCEGTACESDSANANCSEDQTASDSSSDIVDIPEQINENSQNCSDNNCSAICDSDSDCSSEASSDPACSDTDCSTDTAKDNSIDPGSVQKNTYSNINDILKALGITTAPNTNRRSDSDRDENSHQKPDIQNDTETAEPEKKDTDSSNANTSSKVSEYEAEVVRLVNEIRVSYGLQELVLNEELSAVARLKSEDMRDKHYFSHNSPTYGSPFEMMKHFGISYRTAGENIAMGQRTPQEVVDGWMNSEGHRANILNASFKEIGVGYAENGHYWTQMFIG